MQEIKQVKDDLKSSGQQGDAALQTQQRVVAAHQEEVRHVLLWLGQCL